MKPLTHKSDAYLTHNLGSFERILYKMEFKYINHAGIIQQEKREITREFKSIVRTFNIVQFFEDNIKDFETLANYYTSLSPNYIKVEEFNSTNVFSRKRNMNLIFIRQMISYLLRENQITLIQIGTLMNIDHTTAIFNISRVLDYLAVYAKETEINLINQLKTKLGVALCKQH